MGLFRDFILGQPLKKKDDQNPEEIKKVEPEKNEIEFGSNTSLEEFEKIVAGGRDAYGHYKNFHGEYRERAEKRLKEIIESRKKEGGSFNKEYVHNLAKKLYNEPDPASKLLAKSMGYK
jgi:hypothetical protein